MLAHMQPQSREPEEPFSLHGAPQNVTMLDYWRWAHSNIMDNTERGKLAEFIVANALGIKDGIGQSWDSFDLLYKGYGVEIKSASYLQSWAQRKESAISFGIQPTYAWDATTGQYDKEQKRQADVYVFCLLAHRDKATINPLELAQWEFYVVPTHWLNERIPLQKRVSLIYLRKQNAQPCTYESIQQCVDNALNLNN